MSKCGYDFCGIEEDVIKVFSERLKKTRISAKLTQQQFADEMGISVAALSYYETGKRVPDIIFLKKVSEYFLIPVDYFLGGTNSTKKENEIISNHLRLSDKAIDNIQAFIERTYEEEYDFYENSDILNKLLENDKFYSVLNLLVWSGYECTNFMPDEDYLNYIATKKMMSVILDTINTSSDIRVRIVEAIIPEQKERLKYYKWLLDQSENTFKKTMNEYYEEVNNELMENYIEHTKELREKEIAKYGRYKEEIREEALKHLKGAQNNGEHNTQKE